MTILTTFNLATEIYHLIICEYNLYAINLAGIGKVAIATVSNMRCGTLAPPAVAEAHPRWILDWLPIAKPVCAGNPKMELEAQKHVLPRHVSLREMEHADLQNSQHLNFTSMLAYGTLNNTLCNYKCRSNL